MKNINYFRVWTMLLLSPFASVSAQPILNSADISPQAGEQYVFYTSQPPSNAQMSPGGANITWDFSNITPLSGGTIYTNFPPINTQFGSTYPTATVTLMSPVYQFTLEYLQADQNQLLELGYNSMKWTNPRTLMNFPITYLDIFTDTASYSANAWIWHVTGTADGYGTLIMPYGTVTNVLRVRENVSRYSGVAWVPELSYSWYQAGTHSPICKYWTDMIDAIFYYRQPFTVGLNPIPTTNTMNVFPNPFVDQVYINVPNQAVSNSQLFVYDMTGKLIHNETVKPDPQMNISVNLENLLQGNYIMEIRSANKVYHSKLTKL